VLLECSRVHECDVMGVAAPLCLPAPLSIFRHWSVSLAISMVKDSF
jgi:hypothetical protein